MYITSTRRPKFYILHFTKYTIGDGICSQACLGDCLLIAVELTPAQQLDQLARNSWIYTGHDSSIVYYVFSSLC